MLLSADQIANAASCGLLLLIMNTVSGSLLKNRFIRFILLIVLVRIFYTVPVYHTFTLLQITRGIVGDLSISGLLVMILLSITYFIGKSNQALVLPKSVCILLIIIGALLYLSTLGFIKLDLYSYGFYPRLSVLISFFILEAMIWYFSRWFALIWLMAVLAFYCKLQTSSNMWDYLFDPVLWIVAIDNLLLTTNSRQTSLDDHYQADSQEMST